MCPWPHAWKSTLTALSKLCLSNCSLHMGRRDVLEHSWNPRRVSLRWPSRCLPQQLQQLARPAPDSRPGRSRTSFTPTQRAKSQMKQWRGWGKTEKQPLVWWTFALTTATKITGGFLFPGEVFGGWVFGQLCHHVQFLDCGNLHLNVYGVELETSSTQKNPQWEPWYFLLCHRQLWLVQHSSHYSTCKQTSWEISRIRDGKKKSH